MSFDIPQLKRKIELPDLIAKYGVDLVKEGSEYKAVCPFHSEKTPSFSVFQSDGEWKYYCFGCGASSDHLDFIAGYENITPGDAIKRLAEIVGGQPVNDNQAPQQRETNRAEPPPVIVTGKQ